MMESFRYDRGPITRYEEDENGFLTCFMRVSKADSQLVYRNGREERIETIPRDELFDPNSIATAMAKPIVTPHPEGGVVTRGNARSLIRGATHTKQYAEDEAEGYLTLVGTIYDSDMIQRIKSGEIDEVSAGYFCRADLRDDGVFVQRNRRYNHFAGVRQGRAGPDVRFLVDHKEPVLIQINQEERGFPMPQDIQVRIDIDDQTVTLTDPREIEKTVNALSTKKKKAMDSYQDLKTKFDAMAKEKEEMDRRLANMEEANSTMKADMKAITEERDKLRSDMESHKKSMKAMKDDKDRSDARADHYQELYESRQDSGQDDLIEALLEALPHLDTSNDSIRDLRSRRDIQEAVIRRYLGTQIDFSGKGDEYVQGRYDAVTEDHSPRTDSTQDIQSLINRRVPPSKIRTDAVEDARRQFVSINDQQWR